MIDSVLVIDFFGMENVARMLLLGKLLREYGINCLIADMTQRGYFEMLVLPVAQNTGLTEFNGGFYIGADELSLMSEKQLCDELKDKRISVVLRNMCGAPSGIITMSSMLEKGKLAVISVAEDIVSLNDSWTGQIRGYEQIILVCDGYSGFKPAALRFRRLAKALRENCSDVSVCTVKANSANRRIELQAQYGCDPGLSSMTDDGGVVLDLILAFVGERTRGKGEK